MSTKLPARMLVVIVMAAFTDAFSVHRSRSEPPRAILQQSTLKMTRGGSTENPLEGGELTSALARLDQEWKIQQRAQGPESRWSKIILPADDNEAVTETSSTFETEQDFVYLLEPPNSIPSCVICFLGGAGLGSYPQIAYNEFLLRLSNKLNAAVITAPYQVGLDHFALSKQSGERLRKALIYCQDDPARQYPENLPTYSIAHSLGAKLQAIYISATQQEYDGVGFLAFNNFSFSQTMSMAKSFAEQLQIQQGRSPYRQAGGQDDLLDTIFGFAEQAIGAIGLDFSPSQADTNRLIEMRYDDEKQTRTRLFVFEDDSLDSSRDFVDDCRGSSGPTVQGLPGNHLTPVFFQFSLDDIPEEAREMAVEAAGGLKGASFGNEQELDSLVESVVDWIKGKSPSRNPNWDTYDTEFRGQPRISGGTE